MKNNSLFDDWLGKRSLETFVHRSETKRSGWETKIQKGYSSYLLGKGPKGIEILREAYRLCKNRMSSMAPGRPIGLYFRGKDSYTNGTRVVISTEVVDEARLEPFEKLDVLLGLTTHETGHILYTDFNPLFIRDKFQKTILNILEDERIEFLIGEEFPGYGAFLEKLKSYYFDFKYTKKHFSSAGEEAFDCFFKFIRYPKHIDRDAVDNHIEFLTLVKEQITPYPLTFTGVQQASCKIADLFASYFQELLDSQDPETPEEDNRSAAVRSMEALADMMNDLETTSVNANAVRESRVFSKVPLAEKIIIGSAEYLHDTMAIFIQADENADRYDAIKSNITSSARDLARLITLENTSSPAPFKGLRNGIMDSSKLIDAVLNCETIYTQSTQNPRPSIDLVLMVDESKSMEDKMEEVKTVAVLFNEALKLLPRANYAVYGFTSDFHEIGSDTITIYKEKNFDRTRALASLNAKRNNRDGRCIRAVVNRHSKKKTTSSKTLLFVVSDGQPYSSQYSGEMAVQDTRAAVEEAKLKGFIPIQIGIGVDQITQAAMFDDYINYDNGPQMVTQISRLLRSRIRMSRS